jgi:hypothetical protein
MEMKPKKTCDTCKYFTPEKKPEGKCDQFPLAVVRESGTCGYFKPKENL